tara:strand:+ start:440 stop:850 length:411 start_codon:yes stop_codon:yes gene_type:complete
MNGLKRYLWCHDEQKMIEDYLGAYVRQEEALKIRNELAKANERVKELETELDFRDSNIIDLQHQIGVLEFNKATPKELNKFAIEKKIEALAHVLSSYKTQKFCPTNYAIQAFNDGVAHLWAHIVNCELQLRKEQEK